MRTRAIALVLIGLFGFQISRVYLVTKVDAFFVCLNTDVWTSSSPENKKASSVGDRQTSEQSQLILESFVAPTDDGGNYIRGCKDTFDGMGLSPLQPLPLPVVAGFQNLPATWVHLTSRADHEPEIFLSPLFQPPRTLS